MHGLPLIGTGDWNDGMNRVGAAGKGESVWLGWFLHATLAAFAPLADARGESARAAAWRAARGGPRGVARATTPGTATGTGAATSTTARRSARPRAPSAASTPSRSPGRCSRAPRIRQRARRAMAAVDEQLVRRDDGLVLLFTPPFDREPLDPGYIKGYPPGVRENGGQYTHAAAWAVIAFAMLGDGDKACELFSMLNPIHHASTRAAVHRYKVEPYVVCADVYAMPPHVGRGGWTWYTGAAGWLYRAGLEWILGFRVQGADARARSLHSERMAGLRDRVPVPLRPLPDHRREPARSEPRRYATRARRRASRGAAPVSRWRTTATHLGCAWCSVDPDDQRSTGLRG